MSIEDLLRDDLIDAQLLEQEKETGIYTYFIKAKITSCLRRALTGVEEPFSLPHEVRDGKVKDYVSRMCEGDGGVLKLFEDAGIRFRMVSLTDAKPTSLAAEPSNRKATTGSRHGYVLGYYDVPKKIGLVQLAERLDLTLSTSDVHLRKASIACCIT